MRTRRFELTVDETTKKLLPESREPAGSDAWLSQVSDYVRGLFGRLDGVVEGLRVGPGKITVTWQPSAHLSEAWDRVLGMLNHGELTQAALLLEFLLSDAPRDTVLLYNLGMAYSDLGELEPAIKRLRQVLALEPDNANAHVALGVALSRQGKDRPAIAELKRALSSDPDNPWAHRNLGGILLRQGAAKEAVTYLRRAAELNPEDQRAWYGLAQALQETGSTEEADEAYVRAIEADEFSDVAEHARQARSAIAATQYRAASSGQPRMDAIMYCVGALEKFDSMSDEQVKQVGFEVAMLGTRGIDVNDPTPKYTLRSLPGQFSGSHLLCLEYVAFKRFAPEVDIGFDLSKEYQAALALHGKKSGGES